MRGLCTLTICAVLLGACGDSGDGDIPPEVATARRSAARSACLSAELLREARVDLETVSSSLPDSSAGAGENDVFAQAVRASVAFSRAYTQRAELQATVYAYADSAVNITTIPAESVRYVQRAEAITLTAPESGTLEANVIASYERDFAALANNADVPCNWE